LDEHSVMHFSEEFRLYIQDDYKVTWRMWNATFGIILEKLKWLLPELDTNFCNVKTVTISCSTFAQGE